MYERDRHTDRPSSEEAGTQFFRFLTRREDAVSRKRSHAWLSLNRDEGSYQLSHPYDRFLDTASSRCVKNRKN